MPPAFRVGITKLTLGNSASAMRMQSVRKAGLPQCSLKFKAVRKTLQPQRYKCRGGNKRRLLRVQKETGGLPYGFRPLVEGLRRPERSEGRRKPSTKGLRLA